MSKNLSKEELKSLYELHSSIQLSISLVEAIEAEKDPEAIKIYIGGLEEIYKKYPTIYSTKEMIRRGIGDFSKIKDKCVSLGLV